MTELEKCMVSVFKDTIPQVTDFVKEEQLMQYDKIELQALACYTEDVDAYFSNEEQIINPHTISATLGKLEMCRNIFDHDIYEHLQMYYLAWLSTLAEFGEG